MKKTILFILFLLFAAAVYSRAGGGHSGGGGHGSGFGGGYGHHHYYYGHGHPEHVSPFTGFVIGFVTIGFAAFAFFAFAILMRRSAKNARKKLGQAQKFDRFWNEQQMQEHVRTIFPRIQSAWMSRDLKAVSDVVTLRFVARFQPLLNDYKRRGILNVIDNVQLDSVKIVDIHDDHDNNKDSFAAYLKGSMKDFLIRESHGLAGTLGQGEIEAFDDVYIFKRKGDQWLLDHIANDPETRDLKLKNHAL